MKPFVMATFLLATTPFFAQQTEATPFGQPAGEDWELRCFPNPTSDVLVIKSSKEVKAVEFYDINGKELKPASMPNDCYSLNDLPAGWIFMLVQSADGFYQRKSVYKQ